MCGATRTRTPQVVALSENALQDSFGVDGNDRYRFTNAEREFSGEAPAIVTGILRKDGTLLRCPYRRGLILRLKLPAEIRATANLPLSIVSQAGSCACLLRT